MYLVTAKYLGAVIEASRPLPLGYIREIGNDPTVAAGPVCALDGLDTHEPRDRSTEGTS